MNTKWPVNVNFVRSFDGSTHETLCLVNGKVLPKGCTVLSDPYGYYIFYKYISERSMDIDNTIFNCFNIWSYNKYNCYIYFGCFLKKDSSFKTISFICYAYGDCLSHLPLEFKSDIGPFLIFFYLKVYIAYMI